MTIKKLLFLMIASSLLCACATTPPPDYMRELAHRLYKFKNKEKNDIFASLGYPNEERIIDENVVYIWDFDNGLIFSSSSHSYYSWGEESASSTYRGVCRIQAVTHKDVILATELQGTSAGCYTYLLRLKEFDPPTPPSKVELPKNCKRTCKDRSNIDYERCQCDKYFKEKQEYENWTSD